MSFRRNAAIARTYVRTQQTKGWFMAQAQQIAVWCSAAMMSIGLLLQYTGVRLSPDWGVFLKLLAAGPVAFIIVLFAILVEGMTIVTSSGVIEARKDIERKRKLLEKSKAKHPQGYTEEQYKKELSIIEHQIYLPGTLLAIFCSFSFLGGELFWHSLLMYSHDLFVQIIGYVLGGVVCVTLIYLETHPELVELGVDRSISSSHLIYRAMDMDAKGQVLDDLSKERSAKLKSAECKTIISEAAMQSIFAPLAETIQNMGENVSAMQLREHVQGIVTEREAAIALAKGLEEADKNTDSIPKIGPKLRKQYNTEQARKCKDHIKKYGHSVVSRDIEKHAEMVGVAPNTLKRHLG